jgi:hypothetical protein
MIINHSLFAIQFDMNIAQLLDSRFEGKKDIALIVKGLSSTLMTN